jgi:chromodomain-helicase-DNA-binding protein 4
MTNISEMLIQIFYTLAGVKKDVLTKLPPKKELIIRVDLSSKQREYYKAILTRNYNVLTGPGGAQVRFLL